MSTVAILGAGPLGAAIAHRLAQRHRVGAVVLVDASERVAAGKALDIRQSGPVEGYDTRVDAAADPLAASSASVVVVADEVDGGEWEGERGLALLRQLSRAGIRAPIVCAGPRQAWLMEAAWGELHLDAGRMVGTAASAAVSTLRGLVGLELDLASAEVAVTGRPPRFVVGWTAATAGGALVTDRVPAHRLLALSQTLRRLWPPGPLAIASATAPIIEALLDGSRHLHPALTVVDGDFGVRGRAVLLPLDLGPGGIRNRVPPTLSPQEKTELLNTLEA